MDRTARPEHPMSPVCGAILTAVLALSLALYVFYDPQLATRSTGPVFVAGLDGPSAR